MLFKSAYGKYVLLALVFVFLANPLQARGLRMNYAEVVVQNLQIGAEYSMVEVVNLPLKVTNKSDAPIKIEISIKKPTEGNIKKGFEPIPDTSWLDIGEKLAEVPANGTYQTDVKIAIPDDDKLLGKKYQVIIRSRVKPEGKGVALTMAINGRLLFTIAPIKQDAKSSKKTKVDLNFSLDPPRVEVKDVICGKRVKILTDEKKPILIKNTTNVKMKFLLQSLDPQETVISLEPNYEACPSPDYLTFKHEKITIGKGREKPLEMYLEIPDKPEYKKKRFQFLVSVATGTATSGSRYLRVLVSTAGD